MPDCATRSPDTNQTGHSQHTDPAEITAEAELGRNSALPGCNLKAPLIFYSTANKVLNTGSVLMSSSYFTISGASLWVGMLGIRS